MKYYRVLFSNDYAKKKGKFGLVETIPEEDDLYLISDNTTFPFEKIENFKFILDDGIFADRQMCIYPWRIISKRFKVILEKFTDDNAYFHPINLYSDDGTYSEEYYIFHFNSTAGFNENDHSVDSMIHKYHVQAFDDSLTGVFFISETVKNEIMTNGLTGMYFDLL